MEYLVQVLRFTSIYNLVNETIIPWLENQLEQLEIPSVFCQENFTILSKQLSE